MQAQLREVWRQRRTQRGKHDAASAMPMRRAQCGTRSAASTARHAPHLGGAGKVVREETAAVVAVKGSGVALEAQAKMAEAAA